MTLRYKCLILDHDDTAVKSTPQIHYPSFVAALQDLRPTETISLSDFIRYCYDPGFSGLCENIMKFSDEELKHQQAVWRKYTRSTVPEFYEMFAETLQEFKNQGGIVTVVSHSERNRIERDYSIHCGFLPHAIFGWELSEHQRKPHPYPIRQILKRFNLQAAEALVLDDLKPGMQMAKSCDVDFAAAGWSHTIPEIKEQMKVESKYYFKTVEQLNQFILCKNDESSY